MSSKDIGISVDYSFLLPDQAIKNFKTPKKSKNLNVSRKLIKKKSQVEIWSLFRSDLENDFDLTCLPLNINYSPINANAKRPVFSPRSRLQKSLDAGRKTLVLLKDMDEFINQETTLTSQSCLNVESPKICCSEILSTPHDIIADPHLVEISDSSLYTDSPVTCKQPLNASTPISANKHKKKSSKIFDDSEIEVVHVFTHTAIPARVNSSKFNDSMDDPEFNQILFNACSNPVLSSALTKPSGDDNDIIVIGSSSGTSLNERKLAQKSQCETPKLRRFNEENNRSMNESGHRLKRHRSLLDDFYAIATQRVGEEEIENNDDFSTYLPSENILPTTKISNATMQSGVQNSKFNNNDLNGQSLPNRVNSVVNKNNSAVKVTNPLTDKFGVSVPPNVSNLLRPSNVSGLIKPTKVVSSSNTNCAQQSFSSTSSNLIARSAVNQSSSITLSKSYFQSSSNASSNQKTSSMKINDFSDSNLQSKPNSKKEKMLKLQLSSNLPLKPLFKESMASRKRPHDVATAMSNLIASTGTFKRDHLSNINNNKSGVSDSVVHQDFAVSKNKTALKKLPEVNNSLDYDENDSFYNDDIEFIEILQRV